MSDETPEAYSVAGAAYGYGLLWTAVVTYPLMAAIQLECARIGLVTGRGLAGAVRDHYPRKVLFGACALLLVANVFNIAADLGGMAEAGAMLTGCLPSRWSWCSGSASRSSRSTRAMRPSRAASSG